MSNTNRTEYFKKYHEENGERIRARKLQLYNEKKVLSHFDKYFVDKDLIGIAGTADREKFVAKTIALSIGERTSPCDYQIVLDAHKKLITAFADSFRPLEFFTTTPMLQSRFYKFCADLPEFSKYKEKLVSMYSKIEKQHEIDLTVL